MTRPRLRIEPGEHITRSKISLDGVDVRPWIASAIQTIKPGELQNVEIRFIDGAQIPDDLIIELYVERKVNGHR